MDTSLLDVVIPGAQKAGTSSLLRALGTHPGVVRHQDSEFAPLVQPELDLGQAVSRAYPAADRGSLRLAKSVGVMHLDGAFARMHAHNPDMRLVFMLREPVSRMYSAYWFARRTGDETLHSFTEAVAREGQRTDVPESRRARTDYRRRSDYVTPLREAAALFGRDRIKVLLLEDYGADRGTALGDLQSWLGLAHEDLTMTPAVRNAAVSSASPRIARLARGAGVARLGRHVLPSGARHRVRTALMRANERPLTVPPLDEAIRADLQVTWVEHNAALAREFGLDLSSWIVP